MGSRLSSKIGKTPTKRSEVIHNTMDRGDTKKPRPSLADEAPFYSNNEGDEETSTLLTQQEYGGYTGMSSVTSGDTDSVNSSMHDIPIPLKLQSFVKRLEDEVELTEQEILSIVFIVRLADAMLKCNYATFLTRSFVEELRKKLNVEDLDMEIDIAASRWSYKQGAVMAYNRLSSEHDGFTMRKLSSIALGVLEGRSTAVDGLFDIQECEDFKFVGFQKFYRQFPGRLIVLPLIASTGCIVYFGGTLVDGLCCLVTGFVASLINYRCSKHPQLSGIIDILVAISTAALSTCFAVFLQGYVCFPSQVLGTVIFFVPGFNFVLSMYEITQSLVLTGIARYILATLKSYALAFGLVLGLWMTGYGGPDRYDELASSCTDLKYQVDTRYFSFIFPFVAIFKLMNLKVGYKQWLICILTQQVALNAQYLLAVVWEQPLFVSNFVPAYFATLAAHVLIVTLNKKNLNEFAIKPTAFFVKSLARKKNVRHRLMKGKATRNLKFLDDGWEAEGDGALHGGYRRVQQRQYQRSDLWFCLAPALALLVPGARIWRVAFFSIVEASVANSPTHSNFSFEALVSGLLVIGMGQVMGVRLGMVTLWACTKLWNHATGSSSSSFSVS